VISRYGIGTLDPTLILSTNEEETARRLLLVLIGRARKGTLLADRHRPLWSASFGFFSKAGADAPGLLRSKTKVQASGELLDRRLRQQVPARPQPLGLVLHNGGLDRAVS